MTALPLAGREEAAGLAAFLARLLHWDKAAVVRLKSAQRTMAVFGSPPFGSGVLAVSSWELRTPVCLDATVPAGGLLEAIDEPSASAAVPAEVTGPSWAGLLPPRTGWQCQAELAAEQLQEAAASVVAEFRRRTEELPPSDRTRARLDALAEEIWSRPLAGTALPLRAVHTAHGLGFLRPVRAKAAVGAPEQGTAAADQRPAVLSCGRWLRLRTARGSVAVRQADAAGPAVVTPRPAATSRS